MSLKFVLIGNYPPDKQESMVRYTQNLADNLERKGIEVEIWLPKVILGLGNTTHGLSKWIGYVDKWILFPLILKIRLLKSSNRGKVFHVCDHSNAPYLASLPKKRSGITCHDVLAIRGAMGYEDAYCPATTMGKVLQRWIFRNLKKARVLLAVSEYTLNQLKELCNYKVPENSDWLVIYNSFNADFKPIPVGDQKDILEKANIPTNIPFILHVGSSQPRKNRKMLLEMVSLLPSWQGNICFAGEPLDEELLLKGEKLNLTDRMVSVEKPDHQTLVALYNASSAFIFPSFSEGFGWPLIEAQACGTPVIASNLDPMPEISSGTALHANPYKPDEFAKAFRLLQSVEEKEKYIHFGFENCKRFDADNLITQFVRAYHPKWKTKN